MKPKKDLLCSIDGWSILGSKQEVMKNKKLLDEKNDIYYFKNDKAVWLKTN